MRECDILIIGGGASGLFAAITAAKSGGNKRIIILERQQRVGKKLLITGNGRCNISNLEISPDRYHSNCMHTVTDILNGFALDDTREAFKSMGIVLRSEGDKLFPYSLQASTVLDVLRFECERLGIETICECYAESISKNHTVRTNLGDFHADAIIIACGGKAAPKTGSDGNGYALLTSLGHSLVKPFPAIVPLKTDVSLTRVMKGVKVEAEVTVIAGNRKQTEYGEALFTDYGVSGPAAMQLSRVAAEFYDKNATIRIDFLPQMGYSDVLEYLSERRKKAYKGIAENLTLGLLNKRVGQAVLKYSGIGVKDVCANLKDSDLKKIACSIKKFELKVTGVCGFESAQTTAGGINLDEFNSLTLESKKARGIYACGEVLDCDGDCGGFNLQWAWSSGHAVGKAAAERTSK